MTKTLLPDELWAIAAPPRPTGGRPRIPDRACLTGIIFVLKSGIPWELRRVRSHLLAAPARLVMLPNGMEQPFLHVIFPALTVGGYVGAGSRVQHIANHSDCSPINQRGEGGDQIDRPRESSGGNRQSTFAGRTIRMDA